jgi:hypothetical protein
MWVTWKDFLQTETISRLMVRVLGTMQAVPMGFFASRPENLQPHFLVLRF